MNKARTAGTKAKTAGRKMIMRFFCFKGMNKKSVSFDDNGWKYKLKVFKKLGFYSVISPVMKEVSFSKGVRVYHKIHTVFGFGFIGRSDSFSGVAFIDIQQRLLLILILLFGGAYTLDSFTAGLFWALFFYFVLVVLSLSDDDLLIREARRFYENY